MTQKLQQPRLKTQKSKHRRQQPKSTQRKTNPVPGTRGFFVREQRRETRHDFPGRTTCDTRTRQYRICVCHNFEAGWAGGVLSSGLSRHYSRFFQLFWYHLRIYYHSEQLSNVGEIYSVARSRDSIESGQNQNTPDKPIFTLHRICRSAGYRILIRQHYMK